MRLFTDICLATATLCLLATPVVGLQAQTAAQASTIKRNAAVVKREDGSTISVSSRRRGLDTNRVAQELNRKLTKSLSSYTSEEIGRVAADLGGAGPAYLTVTVDCDVGYPPVSIKCKIHVSI